MIRKAAARRMQWALFLSLAGHAGAAGASGLGPGACRPPEACTVVTHDVPPPSIRSAFPTNDQSHRSRKGSAGIAFMFLAAIALAARRELRPAVCAGEA
ncbi:MAG: hypothetical protein HY078_11665 [Elusimicrobia bacterium]|nr:hypothetical protein [Elusimicrobiota bacterium]